MPKHSLFYTVEEKCESFGDLLSSFLDGASREKIQRIWAVSAYYDIESIEQLIDHIKSRSSKNQRPELFIVIGTIKHEGLKDLQKVKFGNEFKEESGIRVTNCSRLFHSKGYLVETGRNGMCAIGSMNLTKYGLKEHEEILTYSQYTHSRVPALVKSFKAYVELWRSDERSKKIGAVSQGEKGIRWLPENKDWNEARNEFIYAGKRIRVAKSAQNEFMRGNDSNGSLSAPAFPAAPPFPDITDPLDVQQPNVQRYFGKERLNFSRANDSRSVNERKFTLAFYKLIFEECRKNPDKKYEHDEVTLQYRDALWRRELENHYATLYKKDGRTKWWTCSVRFDVTVTLKGKRGKRRRTCYVFIYPFKKPQGFRGGIRLGVCVEKQKEIINALQLNVSKHWEKSGTKRGQYWKIHHDGWMCRVKREKVLNAVKKAVDDRWIKERWGKELVHLGNLPMAMAKVTWKNSNSMNFLARLLHYAIIRAEIKP